MAIPNDLMSKSYDGGIEVSGANAGVTESVVYGESGTVTPTEAKMVRFGDEPCETSTSFSSSDRMNHDGTEADVERRIAMSANKVMSKQSMQKAKQLLKRSAAKRGRQRSPLPENMTAAEEIKYQLDRMELKIQKAAKMELALLNQSKKLRDQRTAYQRRYEKLSADYRGIVQKSHPDNAVVAPTFSLPPVFPKPGVVDLTTEATSYSS